MFHFLAGLAVAVLLRLWYRLLEKIVFDSDLDYLITRTVAEMQ